MLTLGHLGRGLRAKVSGLRVGFGGLSTFGFRRVEGFGD